MRPALHLVMSRSPARPRRTLGPCSNVSQKAGLARPHAPGRRKVAWSSVERGRASTAVRSPSGESLGPSVPAESRSAPPVARPSRAPLSAIDSRWSVEEATHAPIVHAAHAIQARLIIDPPNRLISAREELPRQGVWAPRGASLLRPAVEVAEEVQVSLQGLAQLGVGPGQIDRFAGIGVQVVKLVELALVQRLDQLVVARHQGQHR